MKYNHRYDYQFHIWDIWDTSNWIMIEDKDKESIDEIEPFVYLLTQLNYIFDDVPTDLGTCRYQYGKDPSQFIWQWDDLFGLAVEYRGNRFVAEQKIRKILQKVNAMGKQTPTSKEGPEGIDRWTTNGEGVIISPNTPEQQKLVDAINKELATKGDND